jgi:diguanylate cyclase (GGDEF)-like protein/PAS domain S-box-containing protein
MLARVLEAAPIAMAVADLHGQLVYNNQAFNDILGYGAGDSYRCELLDLIHADDSAAGRQHVERLMRGEVAEYHGEHSVRHADGEPLWVMLAASRLEPEHREGAAYIIVQITSIELQKKAEEALAYSESRWNFALESARQGVWDHDIRTDTMFYSRMWRIMRGIPPEEAVDGDQEKWLARLHPEDRARILANVNRQDNGDEGFDKLEYRERNRDGSWVWILSRGKPVEWDHDGNPVRTIGTDTDITHLKAVESELAAEKERLRVTLESIADGMIATDAGGCIVFMNPAAEALTGSSSAEAIGRAAADIVVLRDQSSGSIQPCPVMLSLETDRIVQLDDDMCLVRRNGTERDIRCTSSPVRMPDGSLAGAVLVFQDVTQSRSLQRQLVHSASHDVLTNLPNRAAFDQALNAAIAAARDGRHNHCLIYLDLDHFKPVNDTAGHAAGDELLKQIALTIRGCCRSHDMAARIGGDEFAVLLTDCPAESGKVVADKIVRAIAALAFSWAGRIYRVGASAGLTVIDTQPASPLGFMGEADAACYTAKAQGRGVAVAFNRASTAVQ